MPKGCLPQPQRPLARPLWSLWERLPMAGRKTTALPRELWETRGPSQAFTGVGKCRMRSLKTLPGGASGAPLTSHSGNVYHFSEGSQATGNVTGLGLLRIHHLAKQAGGGGGASEGLGESPCKAKQERCPRDTGTATAEETATQSPFTWEGGSPGQQPPHRTRGRSGVRQAQGKGATDPWPATSQRPGSHPHG